MDTEYRDLLIRSIEATEANSRATVSLAETQKAINDTLISHNKSISEIYRLSCEGNGISKANNAILVKYLKWSVIAFAAALGGTRILEALKIL